mmetsp:Transcript_45403/g.92753  ORF Transcript_45403/g.92753 Transcript_45403/m.92753 type:complete len:211 (+) Transcript_45403:170-802(+)
MCLTVSAHVLGVASLPSGSVGTTHGVVGAVTLDSESAVLLAGGGQASSLAVLVHGSHDPVDARVVANNHVGRIHADHLKVLIGSILVNPVGVEDSHVHGVSAGSLLGNSSEVTGVLQLVDTLVLGLSVHDTLVVGPLAATTTNSDAEHGVSLLGLVSKLVSLVGSGGTRHFLDLLALTVLPRSDTKEETQSVTLLLSPDLLKVLVGSHFD